MRTTVASRALCRAAGVLAVSHVMLMVVGITLQQTPSLDEGAEGIEQYYAEANLSRVLGGGYIEVLAFLCLLPVLVFLAQAFGRRTDTGRWATRTALTAGVAYVAITIGTGFAAGAASLWGTQHGLDTATALVVNDIRNIAYFLSLAPLGVHAIALGIAAITDRTSVRWVGYGGVLTGLVLIAAVPASVVGLQDYATLVWIVWWMGLAVILLRGRPAGAPTATRAAPAPPATTGAESTTQHVPVRHA